MDIEHLPWLPNTTDGFDGQKIAIVGYSHYSDEPDHASLTEDVVRAVISGEQKHQFFRAVQGYFGFPDDASFWNRVILSTSCPMR